jgi:hypothetical protein
MNQRKTIDLEPTNLITRDSIEIRVFEVKPSKEWGFTASSHFGLRQ